MDKALKTSRKHCISVLAEKLGEKSAKKYESAIYEMSQNVDGGDYNNLAYDKISQILSAESAAKRREILNDIKNFTETWDSTVYKQQKILYDRTMDRTVQKLKSLKGVYVCNYKGCKSDEFYVWSAQTKSCDEGTTQYRQCAQCNKRKKE